MRKAKLGAVIDLEDLRKRPKTYQDAADKKNSGINIKEFLDLDQEHRDILKQVEEMRAQKNEISKCVPTMEGAAKKKLIAETRAFSDQLKAKEEALAAVERHWQWMQLRIPAI